METVAEESSTENAQECFFDYKLGSTSCIRKQTARSGGELCKECNNRQKK